MLAFCSVCQADTEHTYILDSNGEHLLTCQQPIQLVQLDSVEYRLHQVSETDAAPYDGSCQHFIKLPGNFTVERLSTYLEDHRAVNDRRAAPLPACAHKFSTVAADHRDSTCDTCGKTHRELFPHAD